MVAEVEVLKLVDQLKRATSLNEQMRILGRSWRIIRGLTKQQRAHLAAQVGLSEAETLLESLGRPDGIAPARLLRAVREAERSRPGELKQLILGVRDPATRAGSITRGIDILQEAFVPEAETEPGGRLTKESPVPPLPPPARPVASRADTDYGDPGVLEPETEAHAPTAGSPIRMPVAEPPDPGIEIFEPEVVPEQVRETRPESAPQWVADQLTQESRPEAEGRLEKGGETALDVPVPIPATGAPTEEVPSAGSLLAQLSAETSLLRRFRLLHLRMEETLDLRNKCQALEAFPAGWPRRRALCALIEYGTVQTTDDLLPALDLLQAPWDKDWCISAFLHHHPQQAEQLAQRSGKLISPTVRRLISRARD